MLQGAFNTCDADPTGFQICSHLLLCGSNHGRPKPGRLLRLLLVVVASIHLAALTLAGLTTTGGGWALGRQAKECLHNIHIHSVSGQDSNVGKTGVQSAASILLATQTSCGQTKPQDCFVNLHRRFEQCMQRHTLKTFCALCSPVVLPNPALAASAFSFRFAASAAFFSASAAFSRRLASRCRKKGQCATLLSMSQFHTTDIAPY
jgi:hypothetical protein